MRCNWVTLAAVSFATAPAAAATPTDGKAALATLAGAIDAHSHATSFELQLQDGKPIARFADYSLADARREAALRKSWLAALNRVDPKRLDANDRESYEIIRFDLDTAAQDDVEYWLTFDLTPYQAPMVLGIVNRVMASRPLATPAEARDYVRLVDLYAMMLDGLAVKLDAQAKRGIYMPKAVLPVVRSTWATLAAGLGGLRPADARLAGLDAASRIRLLAEVDRAIAGRLKPRIAGLIAAIGPAYEAKAPEAVGLAQYPGGKALYERLVVRSTTLPMTPEQMRDIGLRDVAEIQGRMAAIRKQLGFDGTTRQFLDKIGADPRFIAKSPDDLARTYDIYVARMAAKVPAYFQTLPKAPYGARRLPLEAEAGQTYGYYNPPGAGEPRGIYYFNASNLDKRSTINAEPIILHELIPGHHFQIALQHENEALPPFRRNAHFGAFMEGWGEYSSSLGIEAGLYETPEALYGRYANELFLTARLVVDSGMNYFGWPLEKARAYLRENSAMSEPEIASETLRYSVNLPGQALAYHIGYATFWDLRRKAEQALGPKFDIRSFHDVLLLPGARPMSVVAQDVDAWIARRKAA